MSKILYDRVTVADALGISTSTLDRYVRAGILPAPRKIGGLVRWYVPEVHDAVEALPKGRQTERTATARGSK